MPAMAATGTAVAEVVAAVVIIANSSSSSRNGESSPRGLRLKDHPCL